MFHVLPLDAGILSFVMRLVNYEEMSSLEGCYRFIVWSRCVGRNSGGLDIYMAVPLDSRISGGLGIDSRLGTTGKQEDCSPNNVTHVCLLRVRHALTAVRVEHVVRRRRVPLEVDLGRLGRGTVRHLTGDRYSNAGLTLRARVRIKIELPLLTDPER